jgi:phage shock protein A
MNPRRRAMLEQHVDRAEGELAQLKSLLAKACHVNKLTDEELNNLCELVREYEGTLSLHESLTEQLEMERV